MSLPSARPPQEIDGPIGVHPRPQLVRDSFVDLCGVWQFAYDDDDVGLDDQWQLDSERFPRSITVPFPPESALSGIGDKGFHAVVWYQRTVAVPEVGPDERLLLHFGAVDYEAIVWANGAKVGEHRGGHTPFTCDVTAAVAGPGPRELVVVVRAEDQPVDVGQPRGKQDWKLEPHVIWYHRTTGIWQPVWLEVVASTYITELQWTPDLTGARVRAEVRLNRMPARPSTVRILLSGDAQDEDVEVLGEQSVVVREELTVVDIAVPLLRHPQHRTRVLWRPSSPYLVDARVQVVADDAVVDDVSSYLGLRSVDTAGGRMTVNGRAVYLRGVLAQGYWPESHLAAPDATALRREVELVKELGFTSVRVHQKVEDPRFLYWCDRLGVLVWAEMANAFRFDTSTVERLTSEWVEVLRRDRSHPCIVTWVPHNESWGIDDLVEDRAQRSYATAMYHLTKAIDPTRPVISNDGWEHTESDLWTVHDYASRGMRLRHRYGTEAGVRQLVRAGRVQNRQVRLYPSIERGQPVVLSEFGGVRFEAAGDDYGDGWGYSEVRTREAFLERLEELFGAVRDSPALAGWFYTQLTDTVQEQNGLLTEDRRPKAPVKKLRAIITRAGGMPPHIGRREAATEQLRDWAGRLRSRRAPRPSIPGTGSEHG